MVWFARGTLTEIEGIILDMVSIASEYLLLEIVLKMGEVVLHSGREKSHLVSHLGLEVVVNEFALHLP